MSSILTRPAANEIIAAFHALPATCGYQPADAAKPYARFLQQEDEAWAADIAAAHQQPLPDDAIDPFPFIAAALTRPGYRPHETGWCRLSNGAYAVAVHTPMPGVLAHFWDWWFAWHGSASARYKLWAPSAHMAAAWKDGEGERKGQKSYIGRISLIKEMIGSTYLEGAIRFVDPTSLGFPPDHDGTVICGRAGEVGAPIEHTWLIHHIRNTPDGCEMRSRFYLGHNPTLTTTGAPLPPPSPDQLHKGPIPAELLVHCATEMHHLAGFLPALHAAFGPDAAS